MAFCQKCGAQLPEGAKTCPSCGAGEPAANTAAKRLEEFNNTPDTTGEFSQKDIADNKTMAVLAYIIFLIPLFAAKDSKFARFHTNQGLVLVILAVVYGILTSILSAIFYAISWRLGMIMGTVLSLAGVLVGVLAIIGIINAAQGKAKELPLIGKIKILK